MSSAGARPPHADASQALVHDPSIVGALILVGHSREILLCTFDSRSRHTALKIGQSKDEHRQNLLIVGIDLQNVETDTLGGP
jgi:hypothetical protein